MTRSVSRRSFLALGATLGVAFHRPAGAKEQDPEGFDVLDIHAGTEREVGRRALVFVPRHLPRSEKHRMVVLLHGFGQIETETRAVQAWWKDYGALDAYRRLRRPPIRPALPKLDYWRPKRLTAIETTLGKESFHGFVLVCPYTVVPYWVKRGYSRYADWLEETLLPEVRKRAPVHGDAANTGLAGHSMGGQVGLEVMLRKPELFGAFSGVQLAMKKDRAWRYATRLREMIDSAGPRALQLHTARSDSYHDAIQWLHHHLAKRDVPVDYRDSRGTHTSAWMRELGSVETLLWQDRVLGSTRIGTAGSGSADAEPQAGLHR